MFRKRKNSDEVINRVRRLQKQLNDSTNKINADFSMLSSFLEKTNYYRTMSAIKSYKDKQEYYEYLNLYSIFKDILKNSGYKTYEEYFLHIGKAVDNMNNVAKLMNDLSVAKKDLEQLINT